VFRRERGKMTISAKFSLAGLLTAALLLAGCNETPEEAIEALANATAAPNPNIL
jgi:uncharacterized lipoprotein YajG